MHVPVPFFFLITKLFFFHSIFHTVSQRCKYDHGTPCLKLAEIKGPFANTLHSGKGEKKKLAMSQEPFFSTANTVQRKQCAKSHQSVCSLMNDLLNKHFMGMYKYCLENS